MEKTGDLTSEMVAVGACQGVWRDVLPPWFSELPNAGVERVDFTNANVISLRKVKVPSLRSCRFRHAVTSRARIRNGLPRTVQLNREYIHSPQTNEVQTMSMGKGAAVALGLLVLATTARADVIKTFDFSGTLTHPLGGDSSVTGQFTLDETSSTITAFDFTIPGGTVTAPNWSPLVTNFVANSPTGIFVVFSFSTLPSNLTLIFDTTLTSFGGGPLYTGGIRGVGAGNQAALLCLGPSGCTIGSSAFSNGTATLVSNASNVPEPTTLSLFGAALFGLGAGRLRTRNAE